MSDKGKLYTLALAILLAVGFIGFGMFLGHQFRDDTKMIGSEVDFTTTVVHDTIFIKKWDTITEQVTRYKLVQVDFHDTIVRNDTLFVELPFTQKHYHKDSICDIWVSGYEPCLDSANIIQKERIIIEKHYLPVSEYKNSIGVIGGINNCALMYQRNIGRRFQVGGYVGSDYSGKTQAGINAGFRF